MSHHKIEIKNLFYRYPDGTEALKGINLEFNHGDSVAIVGGNGAGKSTLLLHLNGSLRASSGEVRIGNLPVSDKTLSLIRRSVGMVFQDPDDQLFMGTVYDDVAFAPFNLGLSEDEISRRVENALALVGLSHLKGKQPHRLSVGEKKRIAIATVLSGEPDILVLDEPTANLDPSARRRLIEILKGFTHTKIIATHDISLAFEIATKIIVMNDGLVRADSTPQKLIKDSAPLDEYCFAWRDSLTIPGLNLEAKELIFKNKT